MLMKELFPLILPLDGRETGRGAADRECLRKLKKLHFLFLNSFHVILLRDLARILKLPVILKKVPKVKKLRLPERLKLSVQYLVREPSQVGSRGPPQGPWWGPGGRAPGSTWVVPILMS